MRWMVLALGVVLSTYGCGDSAGSNQSADAMQDSTGADTTGDDTRSDGSEMSGEELFQSYCALCHGESGEGTDQGYELRHPYPEYYTWVVRNGRPGPEFGSIMMAAFGEDLVSDQQLQEIWTWLDSFPQPTTGAELYDDYCANCHGTDARGGVVGKTIVHKNAGDVSEKCRAGQGGVNYAARAFFMPRIPEGRLSSAEIGLIADYLGTLPE